MNYNKLHFALVLFAMILIINSVYSCKKNELSQESIYGVLIDVPVDLIHLEGKAVTIASYSKRKGYSVYLGENKNNNSPKYIVQPYMLLLFPSLSAAISFQNRYQSYIGVYLTAVETKALYETPNFNASRFALLSSNSERKIITPILTPKNIDAMNNTNNEISNGYWIRVQFYDINTQEYLRGWELLSNSSRTIFKKANPTNPSLLWSYMKDHSLWKKINLTSQVNNIFDDYELFLEQGNTDTTNQSITIRYLNETKNIPIISMIPSGDYSAVIPSQDIYISWDANAKIIEITYPNDTYEMYIPINEEKIIAHTQTIITNIATAYTMLTQGNVGTRNYTVWKSDLYGIMRVSTDQAEGFFKIDIDWDISNEIAQLHFPPKTTKVKGSIYFTHTPSIELQKDIDTILTLDSAISKQQIYLALKIIDKQTIGLQFIPEANVLSHINTSQIITAKPALPRMIFRRTIMDTQSDQ